MSFTLSAGADELELLADNSGECTITLVSGGERRLLGRDPFHQVKKRLVAGLNRALSDEFTVVGAIDGMPVVHLLSFQEATASLYLTMDTKTLIVQSEVDSSVWARLPVDQGSLKNWVDRLQG